MTYLLGLFGYGRKDSTAQPTIETPVVEKDQSQKTPVAIVAQAALRQPADQNAVIMPLQSMQSLAPSVSQVSGFQQSEPFSTNKRTITEVSDTKKEKSAEQDPKVQKMQPAVLLDQAARIQGVSVALHPAIDGQKIEKPEERSAILFEQNKSDFLSKFPNCCFKILTSFTTFYWFAYKNDFIKDKEFVENAVRASAKKEEFILALEKAKEKVSSYAKHVTDRSVEEVLSLIEEKRKSLS